MISEIPCILKRSNNGNVSRSVQFVCPACANRFLRCVLICWNLTVLERTWAIKTSLERSAGHKFKFRGVEKGIEGRSVRHRKRGAKSGVEPRGEEFFQFCKSVINKGEHATHSAKSFHPGFRWGRFHVSVTFSSSIVISRWIGRYLSRPGYSLPQERQRDDDYSRPFGSTYRVMLRLNVTFNAA